VGPGGRYTSAMKMALFRMEGVPKGYQVKLDTRRRNLSRRSIQTVAYAPKSRLRSLRAQTHRKGVTDSLVPVDLTNHYRSPAQNRDREGALY